MQSLGFDSTVQGGRPIALSSLPDRACSSIALCSIARVGPIALSSLPDRACWLIALCLIAGVGRSAFLVYPIELHPAPLIPLINHQPPNATPALATQAIDLMSAFSFAQAESIGNIKFKYLVWGNGFLPSKHLSGLHPI